MAARKSGTGNYNDQDKLGDRVIIRTCEEYLLLLKDCNSWRNKFHEYYVNGEWPACCDWEIDHKNCILWTTQQSKIAKDALIASELQRLTSKKDESPPVWELRTGPCSDWTTPTTEDDNLRKRASSSSKVS